MRIRSLLSSMFALDLRSLALMRILLGSILVLDLLVRSRFLTMFYTDKGILPREALFHMNPDKFFLSVHVLSGSVLAAKVLFIISACFALSMLIGYKTRLVTFLTWFMHLSLINRNPYLQNSGDIYMSNILLFAVFLPWGERFSLDAFRDKTQQFVHHRVASLATAGFIIQAIVLYLFTGILKAFSAAWQNGEAVYFALSLGQMNKPVAQGLLEYTQSMAWFTKLVPYVDIILPCFFLMPFFNYSLRLAAVICLIAFHLVVWMSFHIAFFSPICIAILIGLLPSICWGERKLMPVEARRLPFASSVFLILLIHMVVTSNIKSVDIKIDEPPMVTELRSALYFNQNWKMFVRPPKTSTGFLFEGLRNDGSKVVILANSYKEIEGLVYKDLIKEERLRKVMNFTSKRELKIKKERSKKGLTGDYFSMRKYWGRVICRDWNRAHPLAADKIKEVSFIRTTLSNKLDDKGAEKTTTVFKYQCQ